MSSTSIYANKLIPTRKDTTTVWNTSIIYSNYILTRSFELTTQIYFVKVTRTRPFLGKTFTVCKYKIGVYAIDLQPKCSPNCNQLRFSCCADKMHWF